MTPIEECAQALLDPSAALLVGAGASAPAGLPTWRDLLSAIASTLPEYAAQAVRGFVEQDLYLEAAQTARMAVRDDDSWYRHFEAFDTRAATTSTWKLLASMGIPKIATTNWDNIGADSFAAVWQRAPSIYVGVDEILQPLALTFPHVVHPHGKAPRRPSLVFTLTEYERAEADHRYKEFWIDLLKRPLLIVAFSGVDPAFQRALSFIKHTLRIGHLFRPFVFHPRGRDIQGYFPNAVSLPFDQAAPDDFDGLREGIRTLRDALQSLRYDKKIDENPFLRAGLPAHFFATPDRLRLALLGVDLRSHCGSGSFASLTILLDDLLKGGRTSHAALVETTVEYMRVSEAEAVELSANALEFAKIQGWIRTEGHQYVATETAPKVQQGGLDKLIDHIAVNSQSPMNWTRRERADRFIKDASLAYLGGIGGQAARSLLGLESTPKLDASRLQFHLNKRGLGFGDSPIERQICTTTIRTLDDPPDALKETCGRLSNFSVVSELISFSSGRELLQGFGLDWIYFDTNILLPAIAPGHPWHTRCLSLIEKCRRTVRHLRVLDGFMEELDIQAREAQRLANELDSAAFYALARSKGRPNGFLDAFAGWMIQRGDGTVPTYDDYLSATGLSAGVSGKVTSLSIGTESAPREWGRFADVHAKARVAVSSSGRADLAKHEADQIALLAQINEAHQTWPARFVTAHTTLRRALQQLRLPVAAAVVPPIALSHLLSAVAPTEIPPASLRELAFARPGIEVAQILFGVLLDRWRNDAGKLQKLVQEELFEKIREEIRRVSAEYGVTKTVDARKRLMDVIAAEVIPAVEATAVRVSAGSRAVAAAPTPTEDPAIAAERLAEAAVTDEPDRRY